MSTKLGFWATRAGSRILVHDLSAVALRRSRSPRFGSIAEPRGGLPVQRLFSTGMRIPSRFRRKLLPRRIGFLPPCLGGGPLAMATIAVGESVGRGAAVRLLPCRTRR